MENRFKDKVVLITGSASGIGEGAALYFAKEGAKIVIASRRIAENESLLKKIESLGTEGLFVATDVSRHEDVKSLMAAAVERFGTIDIALNNAGVEGTTGVKTGDYTEDEWDRVIDINLKGVWLCMKYQAPIMVENGGGAIINVSSLAGLKGGRAGVAYHASKFGVIGATKATAIEYAKYKVTVNAICPAVIVTPMAERAFFSDEKRKEQAKYMHPVGRFGTVEEVVGAISWLASPAGAFVTGTAIPIDGGAGC